MFSLHDFAMSALTGMIGNYPDWQVREYAIGWHDRKHLTEDDLATVETAIAAYREAQQHPPEPPLMPAPPTEPEPTSNPDEPAAPAEPESPEAPGGGSPPDTPQEVTPMPDKPDSPEQSQLPSGEESEENNAV